MPRRPRCYLPDGTYHVWINGNRGDGIFLDDNARAAFLYHLRRSIDDSGIVCEAYCILTTHAHFQFRGRREQLSKVMHLLNTRYSTWFNREHGIRGHVFGGRFTAYAVEDLGHRLECARYVPLNVARAGIRPHPKRWYWCNYSATAGLAEPPSWLSLDWLVPLFGATLAAAQVAFIDWVEEQLPVTPWEPPWRDSPGTVPGTRL